MKNITNKGTKIISIALFSSSRGRQSRCRLSTKKAKSSISSRSVE